MSRRRLATAVAGITGLSAVGLLAPAAAGAAVVCGQTITASTILTADMTCTGTAIFVNGSGITLDLGGHTITGAAPAGGTTRGVNITPNRPNVTVTNGTIRGFDAGVSVNSGSSGALITRLTLDANGDGVRTNPGSSGARIVSNNVTNTGPFSAIQLEGSGHYVAGNTISNGASTGIFIIGDNDVIEGNTITDMAARGISIDTSPSNPGPFMNNRIIGNTITGSGRVFTSSGISINNASGTVIQGNTVSGRPGAPDVFVNDSTNTVVTGNTLTNAAAGVIVRGAGSVGTNISYNTATSNRQGLQVEAGTTDTRVIDNTASNNAPFSGIFVQSPSTLVAGNTANGNAQWGISAVNGVTDGGGNRASGNGVAAQCTPTIHCS